MKAGNRDEAGRFLPGNPGGPGNPYAKQVAEVRAALLDAVTPEQVKQVVRALVDAAVKGQVAAAKVLLDRLLGPPVSVDLIERIEALEEREAEREAKGGRRR